MPLTTNSICKLYIGCFLFLFACNSEDAIVQKNITQINKDSTTKRSVEISRVIHTNDYRIYLQQLNKKNFSNISAAINTYIQTFANADSTTCDTAFMLFNQFYADVHAQLLNNLNVENLAQSKKAKLLPQLKQNGFRILQAEGVDFLDEDRDSINPKFYNYVSAIMKHFLQQQHIEINNPVCAGEGGLMVEPTELVDRFIFWNKFKMNQTNFLLEKEVANYQYLLTKYLFFGMENTPLISYNEKLNPTYEKAYDYLFSKYGNELFVKPYKPYYYALQQNDSTAIESFKLKIRKQLKLVDN